MRTHTPGRTMTTSHRYDALWVIVIVLAGLLMGMMLWAL
jgi:hypothetical protein